MLRLHATMYHRGLDSYWYEPSAVTAKVKPTRGHARIPAINKAFFTGVKPLTPKEMQMRGRAASTNKAQRLALSLEKS